MMVNGLDSSDIISEFLTWKLMNELDPDESLQFKQAN